MVVKKSHIAHRNTVQTLYFNILRLQYVKGRPHKIHNTIIVFPIGYIASYGR